MTALLNAGGGVITDESNVDVISAGLEVGNYSSIVIDGIEYSMNERGINVVLYDTNEKKVIDSLNFDIYEGAKISRKLLPIDTLIYEKASLKKAIDKIYDAVVVIQVYNADSLLNSGTGFIYKVDKKFGYILTNEHVLSDTDETKIILSNDEEVDATVLGKDKYLDLAVLKIDKKYVKQVATLSTSENSNLGDTVFTVGSPIGYDYRGSVTSGVLSGKDRMVSISLGDSNDLDWKMKVLQLDASINPGNSGGPLLNVNGEVIGICSMKLVDDNIEGMGFAIPIEYAMSHIDSLESGKAIKWPVLGIEMINATDSAKLARYNLSVPKDINKGVVIYNIREKTKAAESSLKKGDIIIEINNQEIEDIASLKYELYKYQKNDKIDIKYIRNKKIKTTKVKLG